MYVYIFKTYVTHICIHIHIKNCKKQQLWFSLDFPSGLAVKNLSANTGDVVLIPGSGRFPGERNGNPFQYSCLKNPIDRSTWKATVHGFTKSQTQLSTYAHTHHIFFIFQISFKKYNLFFNSENYFLFYTRIQLISTVVSVSDIQQSDTCVYSFSNYFPIQVLL